MIGVQMRAQHIIDVFGRKAGRRQIGEIRPVLLMITQLVRALLVIARTGVHQDSRARRLDNGAVKRKNHQTADWIHQPRSEPAAMPLDDLGRGFGMNYGWLEQRCLELEHAGNFDLTYAPVVYRTGGCRHRLRFLLSPGLAGSPEWIIRHGLTRGRRDRAIVRRMQKALVHS